MITELLTTRLIIRLWHQAGTRLPLQADLKYNLVARYNFPIGSLDAYLQGVMVSRG